VQPYELTQTLVDSASSGTIAEAGTGRPTWPLRQNISATNTDSTRRLGLGAPPLTNPRPPALSGTPPTTFTRRPTRACRAPPKSATPRYVPQPVALPHPVSVRTASGPQRTAFNGISTHDFRLRVSRQSQMEPVVSNSRMAENARLASDMDTEQTKVAALQAEQLTRTRELATACTQEISHRRELIPETDELEALRKWHVRELFELEAEARQRERELHDVNADLTATRGPRTGAKDCHITQRGTRSARSSAEILAVAELGAAGAACYSPCCQ
jgi:hypothetical protein